MSKVILAFGSIETEKLNFTMTKFLLVKKDSNSNTLLDTWMIKKFSHCV